MTAQVTTMYNVQKADYAKGCEFVDCYYITMALLGKINIRTSLMNLQKVWMVFSFDLDSDVHASVAKAELFH